MATAAAAIAPITRRERRRHEVRARIIEAAMRLFDAKGFTATTVAEICDAADVAEKTFFNHYASKPDMLREVARLELDILVGLIADAGRGDGGAAGSIRERLERFFRMLADRVETAGPMRRELLTELVHLAHEAGTGSAQARTLHGAFAALLRTGAAPARGPAAETAVDVVLGAFYALMLNWANIEGYPLRRRALAMARFLGDAITDAGRRRR
jgi:AcrR family transcriptional regulator